MFRLKTKILDCVPGRRGQSAVELALLLPVLALMLGFIIQAYKAHYGASDRTIRFHEEKLVKFNHGNGMVFDPTQGIYIPAGNYTELIPPDSLVDPSALASNLALGLLTDLGLSKLFDTLNIDTTTYHGAFAQGFSYSLANSAATTLVQDGSLHNMNAQHLETATWSGLASAASSQDATDDLQGADATASSLREFLGSGAQAGLIGFFNSQGDLGVAGASAVGGMLNSDSANAWVDSGISGDSNSNGSEILRGATKGAVQSSASGIFGGNWDAKTVAIGAASGAVQTNAFAETLPLTGDDPKNSAMYGAFNGAFSTVVSGGNGTNVLVSAGMGALGSQQTASSLGGSDNFKYRAVTAVGGAAAQYAQGSSVEAIGMGALSGAIGQGVGWAGNQVSTSLANNFQSSGSGTSNSTGEPLSVLNNPNTADDLGNDESFAESLDQILNGATEGVLNAETLGSFEGEPDAGGGSA